MTPGGQPNVPGQGEIQITHQLPPGAIPMRAIEIVLFLNASGNEEIGVRWQGMTNIIQEFGMLEYAKAVVAKAALR